MRTSHDGAAGIGVIPAVQEIRPADPDPRKLSQFVGGLLTQTLSSCDCLSTNKQPEAGIAPLFPWRVD